MSTWKKLFWVGLALIGVFGTLPVLILLNITDLVKMIIFVVLLLLWVGFTTYLLAD